MKAKKNKSKQGVSKDRNKQTKNDCNSRNWLKKRKEEWKQWKRRRNLQKTNKVNNARMLSYVILQMEIKG